MSRADFGWKCWWRFRLLAASFADSDDGPSGGGGGDPLVLAMGEAAFEIGLELGGAALLIPTGVGALLGAEPASGLHDGGIGGGAAGAFAESEEGEAS